MELKIPTFRSARPRAELIASYAVTPPPAPPADTEKPDAKPAGPDAEADAAVAKAIDAAIEAQEADPDKDDPNDEKVLKLLREAQEAQRADTDDSTDAAPVPPAKPAPKPAPKAVANGVRGLVLAAVGAGADPTPEVVRSFAEHMLASMEQCAMCNGSGMLEDKECPTCEGTGKVPAKGVVDDDDSAGEMAVPGAPAPGTPESPPEGSASLNEPPVMPGNDAIMGPAFTIPVVIIEGQPTGDGRSIAVGALDWRTPPIPLMLLATKTHDPMGMDMNAPAVMAGRIDSLERTGGEGDTQIITAKGFCLNDENGQYLAGLCEQMGRLGVSADVAVEESSIEVTDVDEIGFPIEMNDELTKGTIMAVTACPTPAFEGAYMVLGDGSELPAAIPQQTDHEPVTASAHFMTYADCEPCQEGLEVIVASGAPTRPPRAWFENPGFAPGDGRMQQILSSDGEEQWACPLTVTEDGRVFGHIAPWGVCHTGRPGCVTAPPSPSGYALFMRGHLVTAEGEKIRVGTITADTNHAPTSGISSLAAIGHYDNTAFVVAYVAAGEDEYGIWVAGSRRPGASEAQAQKLTANSISGDWRRFGGELDLIAALAVPMPGFPVAVVDHGERQAIVASGARVMHQLKHPGGAEAHEYAFAPSTARALERLARDDARARVAALR